MTRQEMETIVNFDAAGELCELYTADPVWMRKLDKLMQKNPEDFKEGRAERYQGEVIARRFTFPKRFLSIRSKTVKRELTDEQRAELAQRLKNSR